MARAMAWWRHVHCPYCGAPVGDGCVSSSGRRMSRPHEDRIREYCYDDFGDGDDEDYDLTWPVRVPRTMVTVYLPGDAPA